MRLVSRPAFGWTGNVVLTAVIVILIASVSASAMTNHPKIDNGLEQLLAAAETGVPLAGFDKRLHGSSRDETLQVVIVSQTPDRLPTLSQALLSADMRIQHIVDRHIQAILPVNAIESFANRDDVAFIRLPIVPQRHQIDPSLSASAGSVLSEGVGVIGAAAWHAAELDGSDVKVGIIDDFDGYEALLGSELPPRSRVITRSFYDDNAMFNSDAPSGHGTGVAEIIHDVAPGATLYLAAAGTDVEAKEAIAWLINQHVDVLNSSWGFYSGCFRGGGGVFEPDIQRSRRAGVTWATSAGNEADIHWTGTWSDPDRDNRHNFTSTDEGLTLEVELEEYEYSDGTRVATSILYGTYSWDASCTGATDDYEIVVMKETNGQLRPLPEYDSGIGQETDWYWEPGRPIKHYFATEDFPVSRAGSTETYHLVFRKTRSSAPDARLDLMLRSCSSHVCPQREHMIARNSISLNEPAISSAAFTVGAVHHATHCPSHICTDGRLAFYSSQGPTMDGRRKPDIGAPTHVSSVSYGDFADEEWGFGGTSAAAPHVAGAAALVLSAFPDYNPNDVVDFLQDRAEDLGPSGPDNRYGHGLLSMGPVPTQAQPAIERIEPDEGVAGSTVHARIHGNNLTGASSVAFSGQGVTAVIRSGATATSLPVAITIAANAAPGPRAFDVRTPTGRVNSDAVTFQVLRQPSLQASPARLRFSATVGESAPPSQSLSLRSSGAALNWSALATAPWIVLGADTGTTPSDLKISIDLTDLAPGEYQGRIVVTGSGATGGPAIVSVTLAVQTAADPPELAVSPDPPNLEFGDLERGMTRSRTIKIENTGGGTLTWTASSDVAWLSFSPSTGTLLSDEAVNVDVQISTEGLAVGVHEASITISAEGGTKQGVARVQVIPLATSEELIALVFLKLKLLHPNDWSRTIDGDTVTYTNVSASTTPIRVTLPDDTVLEFDIPPDRRVIVVGYVVHIDTRS